jgi:hypothetical protein
VSGQTSSDRISGLTDGVTTPVLVSLGIAISPSGDMPKNRVQRFSEDAACLLFMSPFFPLRLKCTMAASICVSPD